MLIAMLQIKIQNKISTEASYLPNIVNSTQEALIVTSYQGLTIGISSPWRVLHIQKNAEDNDKNMREPQF
jgi:hypothetical protein